MPIKEFVVFLKYSVVGITGTLVDICFLYLFVEYGKMPILLATTISFVLAVINNFILNKYWTFENRNNNIRKQFIKFFIVALVGLGLTLGFMYLFVYVLAIPNVVLHTIIIRGYLISKIMTSCIVLTWNFLGNKYWSFNDKLRSILHRDQYPLDITIIIPAFNEEKRILPTIQTIIHYFQNLSLTYEILVIDDGSTDQTVSTVTTTYKNDPLVKLIHYGQNRGKGFAVKTGIQSSAGKYILFTDADNSTPIEEFDKFLPIMAQYPIIIGSRYIKGSDIKLKQPLYRIMISRLGNKIIRWFLLDGVEDTQCGFKLFHHSAAQEIVARMKIDRWGFDMEVLTIAQLLQYTIKEIPVNWINSADSRVRPIKDTIRTLKELIYIKLNLWGGRYH